MGIQCGIVGLPNVGKSTLFNALTQAGIQAENYPFCTIEPNVGIVPLTDSRLNQLANLVKPEKIIPTTVEFVDIAGLVAGASTGEGLGNQFLATIRETHAIAHVVRCFENTEVIHVNNAVNPLSDIETIETELLLADLQTLEKATQKLQKKSKSGEKSAKADLDILEMLKAHLDKGLPARTLDLTTLSLEPEQFVKQLQLLTQKPTLYVANVDETGFDNNPHLEALAQHARAQKAPVVAVCAAIEAELLALSPEEATLYLESLGLKEPGLERVIHAAYELLGLQTFFTAGKKEVRAWTVKKGALAPQAASVIHTDFEKGFIRAEVIGFEDYIAHQGEHGAKEAGKWRLEGKEYLVKDGDVIHFRFNV